MKTYFLALVLIAFTAFACVKKATPIKFSTQTIEHKEGDCEKGSCYSNRAQYLIAEGGSHNVAAAINDTLMSEMSALYQGFCDTTIVKMDLNAAISKFHKSHTDLVTEAKIDENEVIPYRYEVEITTKELYRSEKTLSLSMQQYFYLGGAHPVSYEALFPFDLKTGKTISLKEIIKDETKFRVILEAAFLKSKDAKPEDTLKSLGLFTDENDQVKLALPMNFAIEETGLRIIYNQYEVASYAFGATDFLLPFTSLKDVINMEKVK